ncbi:MAG TPA: diacylglycerol kinase family protein [Armatimonadota bacterium]|nr:diacylglycerol kinase family protein [Armatimonadota bacterium]
MRTLLVINPTAGSNSKGCADLFRDTARKIGHRLDIAIPTSSVETERIVRQAVRARYDRILCSGGDGTINRVAAILTNTQIPLGIIPCGTINVLARELRIPLDPLQALRVALQGPVRSIDVGLANQQPFTLMAGFGFDAQVVAEIVPHLKGIFGSLTYIATGLQVITRYKRSLFHLDIDGRLLSIPAWLVVVANASYYGYEISLSPEARIDDGYLDLCIFAEHNAFDRLMQIGAVFTRQQYKHANITYIRARSVRVNADPPVQMQLDGDPAGVSPVDITVAPSALQVVVPAKPAPSPLLEYRQRIVKQARQLVAGI